MSLPARARSVVVLPVATLGELLAHGFEVHVWCPRCHEFRQPTIPAAKLRRRFAGFRFRCHCGAPGYPSFRPGPNAPKRQDDAITDRSLLPALPAAVGDARCSVRSGAELDLSRLPPNAPDAHSEGAAYRRRFFPLGASFAEVQAAFMSTAQPSPDRIAEGWEQAVGRPLDVQPHQADCSTICGQQDGPAHIHIHPLGDGHD